MTADHLGSPRIVTDRNGNVQSRRDFLPFGEEIGVTTSQTTGRSGHSQYVGDNTRQKFTTYERDIESGLDYAQARYHSYTHGRFTSPDPLASSAKSTLPQSWNRYSYCLNNPLILVDPTGLTWYYQSGENGSGRYRWFDSNPGDGWSRVENFTYDAGAGHGWVALDPYSSNWTEGHSSGAAAFNTISFSVSMWKTNQFVTGIGDTLNPSSRYIRQFGEFLTGTDVNINESSTPYTGGKWTGVILEGVATTFVGGIAGAEAGAAGAASEGALISREASKVKYIGRLEDLESIPSEQTFLNQLPNLGSPKANYYQNMSVIRKAVRDGYTIRDASSFRPDTQLAPTLLRPDRTIRQTFLGAERNLLRNKGIFEP